MCNGDNVVMNIMFIRNGELLRFDIQNGTVILYSVQSVSMFSPSFDAIALRIRIDFDRPDIT